MPGSLGGTGKGRASALLLPLAVACGGTGLAASTPPSESEQTASGLRVLVVDSAESRSGVARLSLYVDAGARDATPPEVATLAAWAAAEEAGPAVTATVFPDGTELTVSCPSPELDRCLGALGRALSARAPDRARMAHLETRLADARRRAAADPGRTADALALEALLGEAVHGLLPLGKTRTKEDPGELSNQVNAFLADHYGPERALLVVSGAGRVRVTRLARRVTAALPHARRSRAERTLSAEGPSVRVEAGPTGACSVALLAPDAPTAERMAEELPGARALPLRGGALVLARVADGLRNGLRSTLHRAARLLREELPGEPRRRVAGASHRAHGFAFLTGASSEPPAAGALGVGALSPPAGSGGDPAETEARIRQARARALSDVTPELRGTLTAERAALALDNGARILIGTGGASDRVGIALTLEGGATEDPARLHGRAALVVTALHVACRDRALAGGVSLGARTGTASVALVAEAPLHLWARALDAVFSCVQGFQVDERTLELARRELIAESARDVTRAAAAELISPKRPGLIAPLGTPATLEDVTGPEVEAHLERMLVGARARLGIAGRIPVREAALRAARRLSSLPAGSVPHPARVSLPDPRELGTLDVDGADDRTVVITWASVFADPTLTAGRKLAHLVARALRGAPGLEVQDAQGGGGPWGAFAAVTVHVTPEAIAGLPATLKEATRTLDVRRTDAHKLENPTLLAAELGRRPAPADEIAVIRALLSTPPRFAVSKP